MFPPAIRQISSLVIAGVLLPALCSSCASRPEGYEGYQTRRYTVRGQTYQPMSVSAALQLDEIGKCSWYNESGFLGLKRGTTSLGEKVMPWHMTGAHKTLPLPCIVRVTNLRNNRSVKIRINDRGPFIPGRHLDITPKAAKKLGFYDQGLTTTRLEVLSVGDGRYKKKRARFGFF